MKSKSKNSATIKFNWQTGEPKESGWYFVIIRNYAGDVFVEIDRAVVSLSTGKRVWKRHIQSCVVAHAEIPFPKRIPAKFGPIPKE